MIAPTPGSSRARGRRRELGQRLRPKRVADLRAVDRDPRDRVGALVEDVLVSGGPLPLDRRVELLSGGCVLVRSGTARNIAIDVVRLDNWLSQRAETCPDRCALIAGGQDAHLRRARARGDAAAGAAAGGAGVRRGATVALDAATAGIEYVVLLHALMKLGAVAYPSTRGSPSRARGPDRSRPPALTVNGVADDLGMTEADLPAARRARPRRPALPDPHQRHLRRAAAGRPHVRQPPLERRRVCVQPRRRADRPLAVLPAAVPRRRALDRHALRHLRDRGRGPRRLRRRPGRRSAGGRRGDADLGGRNPAHPPARGGRRPAAPAGGARRRRARARGRPRGGVRPRRDGRADLRAHRDRLAGDDARRRETRSAGSARRADRCSRPTCGSRTARSWSRARPSLRAPPTRTAGCTPATSGGSTKRASSTSPAGSAT